VLTVVERVLILKGADLFSDVGPRHLLGLADVAREVEISKGDMIYKEQDPADALYMVVEGRVRLSTGDRMMSEVGPGEAFGTWSLVDDNARGHRAECTEDGLTLALNRDEFYDVAAGDLTLLQEVVRALGKRLRALVAERPEEARVEGEGIEKPQALVESKPGLEAKAPTAPSEEAAPTRGATLAAAAVGRPSPEGEAPGAAPESPIAPGESASSGPIPSVGPPEPK
jgi:signal-transduction protein with cAMP-binding, CBS, and nucleotidyltransferase domain